MPVNASFKKQLIPGSSFLHFSKKLLRCFVQIIFIVFFFFSLSSLDAQQLDSFRNILQHAVTRADKAWALAKFSFALASSNPDSAMLLARRGVQLAKNIKNDSALAGCNNSIGWCYFRLGKKDSAEFFLKNAQTLYHKIKNTNEEGKTLVDLSSVYNEYHDYSKSLNCLIAARALLEQVKNETMLAYVDRTVGVVYRQQGLYDQSGKYFRSAIATFKRLNNFSYLADTYTSYGSVFWSTNNYDSALYYYRSAYHIYKTKTKNITGEAYAAENMANAFYKKANEQNNHPWIDSAYSHYMIALNAFIKLGGEENIKFERMNIGETLRIMGKYKTSAEYLTDAFHYFDSTGDVNYAFNTADGLSRLYKDMGDYKKAYEYSVLEQAYKDTIDSRNRADSIAKMFARYETEKKDRAIQLLNAQAQLDKQQISKQHIIELFSIVSLALAILLFFVLLNRNRIKQQLKEVKVRNQLAGDLHDEVGSSLSSILLLSKMATGKMSDEVSNMNMLKKISINTKEVIDKMSDIVWMMNPKYDEGENLREKLEQYILRIKDVATFHIHLKIDAAIDNIKFPMETRKSIFLIFKEAINNSLKYAEATEMSICLDLADKNIRLIIADNGKGFDKTSIISGNGLETMSLRTKNSKGIFDIESSPNKGTQIKVIMPLPHSR